MVKLITFNRIDYKLPDLSLIDPLDIAIVKFIYEKFGGKAPLDELNAVTVMAALGPKWQESISIPLIKDMVPNGILKALSSSFAEKELSLRIQKLEQLGLIKTGRYSLIDRSHPVNEGQGNKMVYLTNIGKEIAQYNGLLLEEGSFKETVNKLLQLSIPLPIQEIYTINPRDICMVVPNEIIEVEEGQAILIKPASHLALIGIKFLNDIIIGPFNDVPRLVIVGGYMPLTIRKGSKLGYIIPIN